MVVDRDAWEQRRSIGVYVVVDDLLIVENGVIERYMVASPEQYASLQKQRQWLRMQDFGHPVVAVSISSKTLVEFFL